MKNIKKSKEDTRPKPTAPAPYATDPNGSYTGRTIDAYETPVQDADDL